MSAPPCDAAAGRPTLDRPRATVDEAGWAAFRAFKAGITGREGAVASELAQLDVGALHALALPDARGLTQIDHLVRGPGVVVVIETKSYAGIITGGLEEPAWTQNLAGGEERYRVPNAVRQNRRHCDAVERLLVGRPVPVRGLVVSAGTARFAGELASAVTGLEGLGEPLAPGPMAHSSAAALDAAWQVLVEAAARSAGLRDAHLEAVRARRSAAPRNVP